MVLEPPETSFDAAVQDKVAELEETGGIFNAYDVEQDEWLGHAVLIAEEIAEQEKVFLDIQRHQLTAATPEAGIQSRRILEKQDVVMAANASDAVCAVIIAALRNNPVMRCIMSFNNARGLEQKLEVLRSVRTPVLSVEDNETRLRAMPRIFGVIRQDELRLRSALLQCMNIRNTRLLSDYIHPEMFRGN